MSEILNITEKQLLDEDTVKRDYHNYVSYIQYFKNNYQIRISVQNQNLYILPSESNMKNANGDVSNNARLRNNCIGYLFNVIRYELNGIEINRTSYVDIASKIKYYFSLNTAESQMMSNAGWNVDGELASSFKICVPLNRLLRFAKILPKLYAPANMT